METDVQSLQAIKAQYKHAQAAEAAFREMFSYETFYNSFDKTTQQFLIPENIQAIIDALNSGKAVPLTQGSFLALMQLNNAMTAQEHPLAEAFFYAAEKCLQELIQIDAQEIDFSDMGDITSVTLVDVDDTLIEGGKGEYKQYVLSHLQNQPQRDIFLFTEMSLKDFIAEFSSRFNEGFTGFSKERDVIIQELSGLKPPIIVKGVLHLLIYAKAIPR